MSIHRYANQTLRKRIMLGDVPMWLHNHCRKDYIMSAVIASPPYISPASFKGLVETRNRMTEHTGVQHVMDHIVPLNHPKVCGLNVPWNIAVVGKLPNARKSNHWYDCPTEWFTEPEQFRLFL